MPHNISGEHSDVCHLETWNMPHNIAKLTGLNGSSICSSTVCADMCSGLRLSILPGQAHSLPEQEMLKYLAHGHPLPTANGSSNTLRYALLVFHGCCIAVVQVVLYHFARLIMTD